MRYLKRTSQDTNSVMTGKIFIPLTHTMEEKKELQKGLI